LQITAAVSNSNKESKRQGKEDEARHDGARQCNALIVILILKCWNEEKTQAFEQGRHG
jgi:hypothetical protein